MSNLLERDVYGLYVNMPGYKYIREKWEKQTNFMFECEFAQKRLEKIPKWIRKLFKAI
jgi:hypothetical protein